MYKSVNVFLFLNDSEFYQTFETAQGLGGYSITSLLEEFVWMFPRRLYGSSTVGPLIKALKPQLLKFCVQLLFALDNGVY